MNLIAETTDSAITLHTLFPALADASAQTLARIVRHGIRRRVAAGAKVFDAHTPCTGYPLLLSGTVMVVQQYPDGRHLPLFRVHPGESCLLSGACLLGHSEFSATGIAETDVELLIFSPAEFHSLIASDDVFRRQVFGLFGDRLATLMTLVVAIAYQKLDRRLAQALLVKSDPGTTTPQALSNELGSSREIISHLLQMFDDRGWVDLDGEHVRILDRGALEMMTTR